MVYSLLKQAKNKEEGGKKRKEREKVGGSERGEREREKTHAPLH